MKKIFTLLTVLTLLCLTALPALAEDENTVTALGAATVTLTPDTATFTVGVSTQNTLATTAQADNAKAMQKVIDALGKLGVAEEDIQTDSYSMNPIYDYQGGDSGTEQILKGYEVSNNVTVTVRDLTQLPALLDGAVEAGANQSYGMSFSSSKSDDAYDQALQAAVKDAVRKAGLMAQAMGRETGAVLSLEETGNAYPTVANAKSIAYDAAGATPIQSGTLSVTANVSVEMAVQ